MDRLGILVIDPLSEPIERRFNFRFIFRTFVKILSPLAKDSEILIKNLLKPVIQPWIDLTDLQFVILQDSIQHIDKNPETQIRAIFRREDTDQPRSGREEAIEEISPVVIAIPHKIFRDPESSDRRAGIDKGEKQMMNSGDSRHQSPFQKRDPGGEEMGKIVYTEISGAERVVGISDHIVSRVDES
jgi:hypothetical protein